MDVFWGNIFRTNELTDVIGILKQIPVFGGLNYSQLVRVSKVLHDRQYYQNEMVFTEKEPGAGMYIVKSGQVKIFLKHLDGSNQDLVTLKRGDFFGEVALIDEAPRSASAIAIEDSELLGFYRPDLDSLKQRDPRLAANILLHLAKVLGTRLRETNKQLKRQTS